MKKVGLMLVALCAASLLLNAYADTYFCPQNISVTVGADRGPTDQNGYDLYDVSNVAINGKEPANAQNLLFVNDAPALLNLMAPEGAQFTQGSVVELVFSGAEAYKGLQQCNYTLAGQKNAMVKVTSFASDSYVAYGSDWQSAHAKRCTGNLASECAFIPAQ